MLMANLLAWFYWNPPRTAFTIPFIDRPVAWYGILFVLGFILSYFIIIPVFSRLLRQTKTLSSLDILNWPLLISQIRSAKPDQNILAEKLLQTINPQMRNQLQAVNQQSIEPSVQYELLKGLNSLLRNSDIQRVDLERAFPQAIASVKQTSYFLADRLCWFVVAGTLIGARLGLVFFYDWKTFRSDPLEIFKVWNGGLASHGGVIGLLLAVYLYLIYIRKWIPSFTFLQLTDCISVPAALSCCFIRLGNFVNQEILGTPTSLPWGVIFGDPWGTLNSYAWAPRHPVQLYEAFSYLAIFVFLYFLWKKKGKQLGSGTLTGLVLMLGFLARFILEFWKETQEAIINSSFLQMGQWLSIPFILGSLYLVIKKNIVKKSSQLNT